MPSRFLTLLLVALVPLASAQRKGEPPLPRIDQKACPFECCQFGRWKAEKQIQVFDSWKQQRKKTFTVKRNSTVEAITGVHITHRPDRLRALKSIPEMHIRRGDTVLMYMSHGEGYFDFWVNGFSGNDQIYTSLKCSDEALRNKEALCIESLGKKDWWVQIKDEKGRVGWVQGNKGFSGSDTCG